MLYYINVEKSIDEACPSRKRIAESAALAVSGVFRAIRAFPFGADQRKAFFACSLIRKDTVIRRRVSKSDLRNSGGTASIFCLVLIRWDGLFYCPARNKIQKKKRKEKIFK